MIWVKKGFLKKKEERGCDREESTYIKKKQQKQMLSSPG